MPVEMDRWPVPSRLTVTETSVSEVLRVTVAIRIRRPFEARGYSRQALRFNLSLFGGLVAIQPLQFRQYRRVQGVAALPPGAMVKTVTARLMDGTSLRAAQTFSLEP